MMNVLYNIYTTIQILNNGKQNTETVNCLLEIVFTLMASLSIKQHK